MKNISLEELLEAGCHFGHQVTRQNPKARDYIFESRDNIHIIDLEKTKEGLEEAAAFVKTVAFKDASTMVILGAKRQAQDIVKSEAQRAKSDGTEGIYTVTNRWIGGTFTNFAEVAKNFKRLEEIDKLFANEYEKEKFTKKELLLMEREKQKLMQFYSGIMGMVKIPDVLFIIDTHLEYLAVREAIAMGVKVVGITDTNADPTIIDYAIPANDDAVGSIMLITSYIVDAWIEGKKQLAKSLAQSAETAKSEESKENLLRGAAKDLEKTEGAKEKIEAAPVVKPAYKQSAAGRAKDKAKAEAAKKKETNGTPLRSSSSAGQAKE
ncbi:MAG: 30S ribosomal protein S2 [Candidatus Levybacteria bacterium]|nr:30S ribosomal protein S2 [Candidatus Levybacteria bacterium]